MHLIIYTCQRICLDTNPTMKFFMDQMCLANIPFMVTCSGNGSPVKRGKEQIILEIPVEEFAKSPHDFCNYLYTIIKDKMCHGIIAVDPLAAELILPFVQHNPTVPTAYISFEILFQDEIVTEKEKLMKEGEINFIHSCNAILVRTNFAVIYY